MSVPRSLNSVSRHENVGRAAVPARAAGESWNPSRHRAAVVAVGVAQPLRAAAPPTGRSRGTRAPAGARSERTSQSSCALTAKPTHSAMFPRYSGLRTRANGPGRDQRSKAIAARPRDRRRYGGPPTGGAVRPKTTDQPRRARPGHGRAGGRKEQTRARAMGSGQPGPLPEQPAADGGSTSEVGLQLEARSVGACEYSSVSSSRLASARL